MSIVIPKDRLTIKAVHYGYAYEDVYIKERGVKNQIRNALQYDPLWGAVKPEIDFSVNEGVGFKTIKIYTQSFSWILDLIMVLSGNSNEFGELTLKEQSKLRDIFAENFTYVDPAIWPGLEDKYGDGFFENYKNIKQYGNVYLIYTKYQEEPVSVFAVDTDGDYYFLFVIDNIKNSRIIDEVRKVSLGIIAMYIDGEIVVDEYTHNRIFEKYNEALNYLARLAL